ncbi:MAG: galactose-1-phosphate uridylyltransferase [Desulfuromonadales bacterium]|nr:galactose-1-phosphate uridylyltransferase [Desulfuromonadales bacterium]
MSEFRWDPLKATWVITANHRAREPRDFFLDRQKIQTSACPFCPGHEGKTPAEVFALRQPGNPANGPGWQVRVVPNKFPLLRIEGELNRRADGHYEVMQGIGAHEVVIETPDHERAMADFSVTEITQVLQAYRARLLDLRRDTRFRYLQIFKNHGFEAGAPLPHAHSQIMAVPITPPTTKVELNLCRDYFRANDCCLICDLNAQELNDGRRVVYDDGRFLVVAPYASCFPFELRLFPQRHGHDFALQDDAELEACATALRNVLRRLRNLLRDPPFNFILHTAPPMQPRPGHPDYWTSLPFDYHWHIELVPRLSRIAGFEWGSGFFINLMPPEDAARFLRGTDPDGSL